jgi:hypothetical protein
VYENAAGMSQCDPPFTGLMTLRLQVAWGPDTP